MEPLSDALGAKIRGVDLAAPLDESRFAAIRRALPDHLVISFCRQRRVMHRISIHETSRPS